MSNPQDQDQDHRQDQDVTVVGPDGQPVEAAHGTGDSSLTDLVEEPAKVMRIGRMVQQLLEEVKAAPLDEPGRTRLAALLHASIAELKDGLAPTLDAELDRLIQPFEDATPTESELRIAQATLVGWLEGLFHGIQTAIYAQQMAARAQLERMTRALPPGGMAPGTTQEPAQEPSSGHRSQGGMYL